jgi:hypothetical protein
VLRAPLLLFPCFILFLLKSSFNRECRLVGVGENIYPRGTILFYGLKYVFFREVPFIKDFL